MSQVEEGAPALRVPLHRPSIGDEEIAAVTEVLRSGWLTSGEQCRRFESELASFVGARHAVAVNSCTAALHLALAVAGVGRGDVVMVPTMTFAATAEVVIHLGATPLLVDCERDTLNMDPAHAAELLDALAAGFAVPGVWTPRGPRAVVPVHYAGQMADVDAIAALARLHGLRVVEDAAHALPASARASDGSWRRVGTTAEQTCFSFYANKTITTGEGGMLVTDDARLAEEARCLSLHGLTSDAWDRFAAHGRASYRIVAAGYKYNLTDIAAALGRVQLGRADVLAARRRQLADRYRALLGDIEELELPTERPDRLSSWHLYVVRLKLDALNVERDEVVEMLAQAGVSTSVHWRPLHLHPYYERTFGLRPEDFPVATQEWERMLSLPLYPSMTDAEQEHVAAQLRVALWRGRRARVA
jgi:dTDP-4-amino-4,6-dideoxygalactose transaminase